MGATMSSSVLVLDTEVLEADSVATDAEAVTESVTDSDRAELIIVLEAEAVAIEAADETDEEEGEGAGAIPSPPLPPACALPL